MELKSVDVLIVGAGLSGAVIAERFASQANKKVLVVEKRDHIGGNCYDYIDKNNILQNKYGAHLFHTDYQDVWEYVNKFGEWERWDHRVLGFINNKLINIPVNINTVNTLCGTNIRTNAEMDDWLHDVQIKHQQISNSRDMAESRVGKDLYEKIFKYYTYKQWNKFPEELDPSVLARIPVRNNFDDRYFDDRYQALPKKGYTNFVSKILKHPNISLMTNTDFFEIKDEIKYGILIFTGPIDQYFREFGLESLEYRSLEFIAQTFEDMNYYQVNSVINYLGSEYPFTRIVEYKHFLNQKSPNTVIIKELSSDDGEPYYPILNDRNLKLLQEYKNLARNENDVFFLGRLANYRYFNMDQAIKNSLEFFTQFVN